VNPPTITEAAKATIASFVAKPTELYIGGKWQPARSGETFESLNPATGEVLGRVASGAAADVDLAVKAARRAFESPPWGNMPPAARARLLLKLADAIEAHGDELALLETLDNGMPYMMSRMMVIGGSAESLRYHAGWATKINGETINISAPGEYHAYTLREPVGVVGQIVPWNFPLIMSVAKLGPALAVGCTVVLKPAEQTSLSAVRLGQLIQEVGIPDGVVNIVTGYGASAGAALVAHPDVNKIAFTGSTAVGKSILASAAGNLKRVTLELGGKSPVIIFPDADVDMATEAAARGIFMNSGQVCAAGSRLFVHRQIFDRVVEGVVERARKFKVGAGSDPSTVIGPLISRKQLDRVTGYIDSGAGEGAKLAVGGHKLAGAGFFVEPTVLTNTVANMKVMREEIFGPVLCAMSFDDAQIDAIAAKANDSDYGLAASIWTRDISAAHKLARRIKAGSIRINTMGGVDSAMPLGGYKQSGWGRENGREGTEMYTELKSVIVGL
jgi:phenylacetaldehyde dehydrogenase